VSDTAATPPVHIGTSGWSYAHWRGVLYEPGTRDQLGRYLREFDTVELNASFYRWPPPARFAAWRERLPSSATMSVKAPRGVTHARRLELSEEWARRIQDGLRALGPRRGPFLVQLPPTLERDDDRLDAFLGMLPAEARPAVELRHPSWVDDDVFALLSRHGAAYAVMSGAHLACELRATAPFVYVRLHGPDHDALYQGSYPPESIAWWAARIEEWRSQGREVFAYFNNDLDGNAVRDARALRDALAR
jgi:uncharacterized protein YecE (DUF72 family)